MAMYNLDLFAYNNIAEDGKERKYCRKSRLAIYYKKWYMVDFEAVCEVPDAGSALICMGNDHHFVTTVDQLCGKLIDMAFDSSWLREEEVADHSDIVWHSKINWSEKPSPHRHIAAQCLKVDTLPVEGTLLSGG